MVAGCRVRPDGRPSVALALRTELAARLLREGHAARLLFTGGPAPRTPAEAVVAAAYARALGVPEGAILVEPTSRTTEENARHAAHLLGGGRVIVVTDGYHAFRTRRIFRRHFAAVWLVPSTSPPLLRAKGIVREVVALAHYALVRGRARLG
ncbi:MAG: YdcF family protein [Deltaproteobacteria bacterium]|nr:YdcF family protein [Deltaproteobacteria bacterium]